MVCFLKIKKKKNKKKKKLISLQMIRENAGKGKASSKRKSFKIWKSKSCESETHESMQLVYSFFVFLNFISWVIINKHVIYLVLSPTFNVPFVYRRANSLPLSLSLCLSFLHTFPPVVFSHTTSWIFCSLCAEIPVEGWRFRPLDLPLSGQGM